MVTEEQGFPNPPDRAWRRESARRTFWNGGRVVQFADAQWRMSRGGEPVAPRTWAESTVLQFPAGHPLARIVYVSHPLDVWTYIPAADFHRFLFRQRVEEAIRLVVGLGAFALRAQHVAGWDYGLDFKLATTAPAESLNDADDWINVLLWYRHEPVWRALAAARDDATVESFELNIVSPENYGVDEQLIRLIETAGFRPGGTFVPHRNTNVRLVGTFSNAGEPTNAARRTFPPFEPAAPRPPARPVHGIVFGPEGGVQMFETAVAAQLAAEAQANPGN